MERDARLFHVMINFLIELGTIRFESWIRELDSRVDARYQDKRNERIDIFILLILYAFLKKFTFLIMIYLPLMIDIRDYLFICFIIVIKSYISN